MTKPNFSNSKPVTGGSSLLTEGRLPDRAWSMNPRVAFPSDTPLHKPANFVGHFTHPAQSGLKNLYASGHDPNTDLANRGTGSQLNPYYPFGPGRSNKYCALENAPTLVSFKKDNRMNSVVDGRDLWRSPTNPYQFDQTWLARTENARKDIMKDQEDRRVLELLYQSRLLILIVL